MQNQYLLRYKLRISTRSKYIRFVITPTEGLQVVCSRRHTLEQVKRLVIEKQAWIILTLEKFKAKRAELAPHLLDTGLPKEIYLPAINQVVCITYQAIKLENKHRSVRVQQLATPLGHVPHMPLSEGLVRGPSLILDGATDKKILCQSALKRWLMSYARQKLGEMLQTLAQQTGLTYSGLSIKAQRSRWGSCSAKKAITLNYQLLFLPEDLVRYVVLHELCHTLELNHSARFWQHLRHFEPNTDIFRQQIQDAWRYIPTWLVSAAHE